MATGSESPGLSAFDEALGSIQTTAKWIVGAAAVVLGALIGGLQLKDLGPLREASLLPLFVACLACLAAIAGVGWILVAAARVLIMQGLTLSDIARREVQVRVIRGRMRPGERVSDYDPLLRSLYKRKIDLLPDTIDDVLTFRNTYDNISKGADLVRSGTPAVLKGVTYDPGDTIAVARLETLVSEYRERAERLVGAAHLYLAQRAFRRLIKALWVGGIVAVIGIVVFILTTTHPNLTSPVTTPVQVHVVIAKNAPRHDLAAAGLAPACAGQTLTGVAIGGSYAEPVVVTSQTPSCPAQLFTLGRALGIAIPIILPPDPGL
jgi:hypothetical protein